MASFISAHQIKSQNEQILELLETALPDNNLVQDQLKTLVNRRATWTKRLKVIFDSRTTPNDTEQSIKTKCMIKESEIDEQKVLRLASGANTENLPHPRDWVLRSTNSPWMGWQPTKKKYVKIQYGNAVDFSHFKAKIVTDQISGAIILVPSIKNIIAHGVHLGFNDDRYEELLLKFGREFLPHSFSAISQHINNLDLMFSEITSTINSDFEISKIRSSLRKIHRSSADSIMIPGLAIKSLWMSLFQIAHPELTLEVITKKSEAHTMTTIKNLVNKTTLNLLNQFITYKHTDTKPLDLNEYTAFISSVEVSEPGCRFQDSLSVPASCALLDINSFDQSSMDSVVMGIQSLKVGRSSSGNRPRNKYDDRQRNEDGTDGRRDRRDFRSKSPENRDHYNNSRNWSRGRHPETRDKQENHHYKNRTPERHDKIFNGRNRSYSRDGSRGRNQTRRDNSWTRSCMRCGFGHETRDCRKYPFWPDKCKYCSLYHDNKICNKSKVRNTSIERGKEKEVYRNEDSYWKRQRSNSGNGRQAVRANQCQLEGKPIIQSCHCSTNDNTHANQFSHETQHREALMSYDGNDLYNERTRGLLSHKNIFKKN